MVRRKFSFNSIFIIYPISLTDISLKGIIGLGAWGNFGTGGNNFSQLFPGINIRVGTLASNFKIPFSRELLLSLGFVR